MTNPSDTFFGGGEGLNWGPTSDTRWLNRPRGGVVVGEPREEQQTDINTKQPLFWDAARTRPMMQLVVPLRCDGSGYAAQQGWQTDERVDAADQGFRNWYIKGKDLTEALGKAIKANLARGIRVGDEIYGVWTGMRQGKTPGTTARTWWACHIVGIVPAANQAQFFGNEQQPPAGPPAQPAQQTYVPPAAQGFPSGPAGPAPHPGPPPQFGQPAAGPIANTPAQVAQAWNASPAAQQTMPTNEHQAWGAPAAPPAQQPVPPVDNPWGQAPAQAQQPAAAPNPWGQA